MKKFYKKEDDDVIDINVDKIKGSMRKITIIIITAIILLFLIVNSFYVLENRDNGVVLRFGKVSKVVDDAGLHFKIPLIEKVKKVDVKTIYTVEYGYETKKKGTEYSKPVYVDKLDEATVIVDAANNNASIALVNIMVQYRKSIPEDYLFNVDDVEGTLKLALEGVVRTTLQALTLDEVKTSKELIDQSIKPLLQQKLKDYQSGIEIMTVRTQNVEFLPNVETAYQQKENANQYKNGKQEEADKYLNTIIPQAEAEATKLKENASAYRAERIANAKAAVAEFNALYDEYKKNPSILKEKYYIEAMSDFLSNNKIVIDASNNGDVFKFYNFDENKLIKQQISDTTKK
jgi:membrane protease subunit HflK